MKTFKIYRHPTLGSEAVKVGFSWPAFFCGLIWMLVCKLWGKATHWFILYFIATMIETATDTATESGLQAIAYLVLIAGYLALWLVPAFKGNAWRAANLVSKGYELTDTLQAKTKDAAIAQSAKPVVA